MKYTRTLWAVSNKRGVLNVETICETQKEAIGNHTWGCGVRKDVWEDCQSVGDRAVKLNITYEVKS